LLAGTKLYLDSDINDCLDQCPLGKYKDESIDTDYKCLICDSICIIIFY
jgi:hypothetical protein